MINFYLPKNKTGEQEMKETFTLNLWETVDYLNILKSDIKDHLENNAINEALCDYQKLWSIADLGIYAIPDIDGKRAFLHLIQSVADEVKVEIRKTQAKDFYFLEDEVHRRMKQTEEAEQEYDEEEHQKQSKEIKILVAELKG